MFYEIECIHVQTTIGVQFIHYHVWSFGLFYQMVLTSSIFTDKMNNFMSTRFQNNILTYSWACIVGMSKS